MEFAKTKIGQVRFYGRSGEHNLLDWSWVENQLLDAGTYWVNSSSVGFPHPRPVWGIWFRNSLFLSIGSPILGRGIEINPDITVHLESGTDVVIVEGIAHVSSAPEPEILEMYNLKYEWKYTIDEYGPLTRVDPTTIIAWRSTGWAGRSGIQEVGRWQLP